MCVCVKILIKKDWKALTRKGIESGEHAGDFPAKLAKS